MIVVNLNPWAIRCRRKTEAASTEFLFFFSFFLSVDSLAYRTFCTNKAESFRHCVTHNGHLIV